MHHDDEKLVSAFDETLESQKEETIPCVDSNTSDK